MWMCECDWLSMKPVHTCPGAAAVLFQKGFCAFLGPVQVQIQAKICTWISEQKHTGPQTANPALQLFFPPFWIKALCKHPHQCNMVSQNPCYSYLWQTACPVTGSRKKKKKKNYIHWQDEPVIKCYRGDQVTKLLIVMTDYIIWVIIYTAQNIHFFM